MTRRLFLIKKHDNHIEQIKFRHTNQSHNTENCPQSCFKAYLFRRFEDYYCANLTKIGAQDSPHLRQSLTRLHRKLASQKLTYQPSQIRRQQHLEYCQNDAYVAGFVDQTKRLQIQVRTHQYAMLTAPNIAAPLNFHLLPTLRQPDLLYVLC